MTSQQDLEWQQKEQEFLSKHGGKTVSHKALHKLMGDTIDGLMKVLKGAFQSHNDARRKLEERVAALEARPALEFCGKHESQIKSYFPGDVVQRSGALWICTEPTTGPFTHSAFQLLVKRGAVDDAR